MGKVTVRALTSLVWSVAAGSAVFWGLRLFVATAPVPAHAVAAPPFLDAKADLGRLLGTAPVTPAATARTAPVVAVAGFDASRLKLLGVVLPESASDAGALAAAPPSGPAFALIAVEGRPARAFRLGEEVDAGQVLQRLETRRVEIGPPAGPAAAVLSLPEDAPPSRALPAPPRSAVSTPNLTGRPPEPAAAPVRRPRAAER
jgi:general secretion pathway protein C